MEDEGEEEEGEEEEGRGEQRMTRKKKKNRRRVQQRERKRNEREEALVEEVEVRGRMVEVAEGAVGGGRRMSEERFRVLMEGTLEEFWFRDDREAVEFLEMYREMKGKVQEER